MKNTQLIRFFTACLFVCSPFLGLAQPMLLLTDYTFAESDGIVGKVVLKDPTIQLKEIRLKGSKAKLFSLDEDNQIVFRKGIKKTIEPWYDLTVEAGTSAGKAKATFRVVHDQFNRNKVIAHRGAWKALNTAQNSLASLEQAIKLGCFGSEFDVHMSADSVLFVNHDHTIQGVHIEKTAAADLAKIKLSNGESIPTLEAYLKEGIKQNRTRLILEIKTSSVSKERSLALTRKVVEQVRDLKAQGWVDYIGFDYDVCRKVKEQDPFAKVAYLNGDKAPQQLAMDRLYGLDYHFNVLKKNENWLQEAKQNNLTINVWTVNDATAMDWFLKQNVDFITTDQPEALLEKVR